MGNDYSRNYPFHRIDECPTLNAPDDGEVNMTGNVEGSVATYSCGTGYNVTGLSQRECESNGKWSGMEPTCERKLDY